MVLRIKEGLTQHPVELYSIPGPVSTVSIHPQLTLIRIQNNSIGLKGYRMLYGIYLLHPQHAMSMSLESKNIDYTLGALYSVQQCTYISAGHKDSVLLNYRCTVIRFL